ncbi:hypothetical protein BDQ17DRAFT_1332706 [Cyathus striatus]|nr:hypothetical protein BDQ17DRAFT_1332706 [Cyathus striatus]
MDSALRIPHTEETITLGRDLLAAKWYYVGVCTLLAYDYLLTFSREVEEIWEKKKGIIFCFFITNRYVPMAFCVVTLFGEYFPNLTVVHSITADRHTAYFSPLWTFEICNRFAIVEWIQTLLIVVPAETILIYRIYALTNRNLFIVGVLVSTIIAQLSVVFYAISIPGTNNALRIPHYAIEPFHSVEDYICLTVLMIFSRDTAFLALAIFFDATVFILTLITTIRGSSLIPRTVLLRTIQRDGALYFCSILTGNILWMVLALRARPGLKLLNAQPSMVGRGTSLIQSSLVWAEDSRAGPWSFRDLIAITKGCSATPGHQQASTGFNRARRTAPGTLWHHHPHRSLSIMTLPPDSRYQKSQNSERFDKFLKHEAPRRSEATSNGEYSRILHAVNKLFDLS